MRDLDKNINGFIAVHATERMMTGLPTPRRCSQAISAGNTLLLRSIWIRFTCLSQGSVGASKHRYNH